MGSTADRQPQPLPLSGKRKAGSKARPPLPLAAPRAPTQQLSSVGTGGPVLSGLAGNARNPGCPIIRVAGYKTGRPIKCEFQINKYSYTKNTCCPEI